jgi:hypothetical protein
MGVNRQAREELANALMRYAKGSLSPEELDHEIHRIWARIGFVSETPELLDAGCEHVAQRLYLTPRTLNRRYRKEFRRFLAFLRSDLDYVPYEIEYIPIPRQRKILHAYLIAVLCVIAISIPFLRWWSLLLWPAASLPMWVGIALSFIDGWRDDRGKYAPFESATQAAQYEQRAGVSSAMPLRTATGVKRFLHCAAMIVVRPLVAVMLLGSYALSFALVSPFLSIFWFPITSVHLLKIKKWVRVEPPQPCDICRRAVAMDDKSVFTIYSKPEQTLGQCNHCGTCWRLSIAEHPISKRELQEIAPELLSK